MPIGYASATFALSGCTWSHRIDGARRYAAERQPRGEFGGVIGLDHAVARVEVGRDGVAAPQVVLQPGQRRGLTSLEVDGWLRVDSEAQSAKGATNGQLSGFPAVQAAWAQKPHKYRLGYLTLGKVRDLIETGLLGYIRVAVGIGTVPSNSAHSFYFNLS